ncbi:HpcH/HpaI aldolase/citrate lyase family protein [Aquibium oceanicum]|uniref:CoA ester lyase n=1 Tax=Aquibium oceanicum TaxID=1670800 RepID=A0A1L3SQI1_9HYPH|nr:CoA ester lyase [Aquibium oceanicum]APH71631.1 CoA ester lyase [Aquibium oceanicum]
MKTTRLRRCELSVPGSSERMLAKAASIEVDHLFIDLEDAVAPNRKNLARANAVAAIRNTTFRAPTVAVRINDLTTPWALDDITELIEGCGNRLDVIVVPKVLGPQDVLFVERLLAMLEMRHRITRPIGLEVLIEEIQALDKVEQIAAASPRLEALIFGMGDYARSQGMPVSDVGETDDYPGDLYHYHRNRVVIAARLNGLDAIDGPYADFRNPQKYRDEARRAAILGFTGKWAIHPSQIATAEEVFTPEPGRVAKARAMAAAYAEALERGEGAISFEGKMIDVASVKAVEEMIAIADRIDGRSGG